MNASLSPSSLPLSGPETAMRLLSLCVVVALGLGSAGSGRSIRPSTPTYLQLFTGGAILLPARFTATRDSVAVEDTLRFRYAIPTAAAGTAWRCGRADAIVLFAGDVRAGGTASYWSGVPKETPFRVVEIVQTTDRWSCLEVEPLLP